jgi:hypothetical protein
MNIVTILGVVGIVIVCAIPFIINRRKNKKAEAAFAKTLFQFAEKHGHKILSHELSSNIAIGISETDTLFFIKQHNAADDKQQLIDTMQVNGCRLVKSTHSGIDGTSTISKVELVFDSGRNKPNIRLMFYDIENDGFVLNGQLQMAEKWLENVNAVIKKKTISHKNM